MRTFLRWVWSFTNCLPRDIPFWPRRSPARSTGSCTNTRTANENESGLPPELDRIVVKTLAKDKAERYGTATELLADLQAVQQGSFSAPARPTRRRLQLTRRQAAASLALAAIALAAFLGAAPLQQRIKLWLSPVPAMKQLAVLPFDALGGDSQSKAFADGLTETLTAKLTQLDRKGLAPGRSC